MYSSWNDHAHWQGSLFIGIAGILISIPDGLCGVQASSPPPNKVTFVLLVGAGTPSVRVPELG